MATLSPGTLPQFSPGYNGTSTFDPSQPVIGNAAGGTPGEGNPASVVGTPTTSPITTQTYNPANGGTSEIAITPIDQTDQKISVPPSILGDTDLYTALQDMDAQIAKQMQPNALNDYYIPTYHFRLFMIADTDLLTQAGIPPSSGSASSGVPGEGNQASVATPPTANATPTINIANIKQVTIAESGVTGWNIKDVQIHTIGAVNEITGTQKMDHLEITIIDPLGVNFIDGLFGAATQLNVKDYTKANIYLELTFLGYPTGSMSSSTASSANQITNFPNGGKWIWGLVFQHIETSITEGGGVFKVYFLSNQSAPLIEDQGAINYMTVPGHLTVSGKTVSEIFSSFVTEINTSWKTNFAAQLIKYNPIKTESIAFKVPNAQGKNPGNFKLLPQEIEKSPKKMWTMDTANGNQTYSIAKGTNVADFLTSIIINTEEGQKIVIDNPTTGATDNTTKGFRQCIVFAVEHDIAVKGLDTTTNQYVKEITLRTIAHLVTHPPILDENDITNAKDPNNQKKEIQGYIDSGLFKKRYDYIYTGKNTEVIKFDINFDMVYSATLAQQLGTNLGLDNLSINSKLNKANTNPEGGRYQALQDFSNVKSVSDFLNVISNDIKAVGSNISTGISSVTTSITSGISSVTTGITGSVSGALSNLTGSGGASNSLIASAGSSLANQLNTTTGSFSANGMSFGPIIGGAASSAGGVVSSITSKLTAPFGKIVPQINTSNANNTYIEDILGQHSSIIIQNNNNGKPTVSTTQGPYLAKDAGTGGACQYHRSKSIVGSVFSHIYGGQLHSGNAFFSIKLTIRGDPYWLGQTDLETQAKIRTDQPSHDFTTSFPNYNTGTPIFELFFRYPLHVGDNFSPILEPSESFNGLYSVKAVTHIFSEGSFTQVLEGYQNSLASVQAANAGNPNARNGGNGSGNQVRTPSTASGPPVTGLPPGNHWQIAATASLQPYQISNTTTVGDIPLNVYNQYLATMSYGESTNNLTTVNGGGYAGLYQMGTGALQTANVLNSDGSFNTSNPYGATSLANFYGSGTMQTAAFNVYTQANYNTMVSNGTITSGMPIEQQVGFLGAAQLGSAKSLSTGVITFDGPGAGATSNANYYNLAQASASKVTGNTTYYPYKTR